MSASSLFLEVFLVRFFSVTQWNHLSFVAISIALLGYSASGTAVSLSWRGRSGALAERIIPAATACFALAAPACFAAVRLLPLDYFRLPVDPRQIGYLALTLVLLAIPFFFAGLSTSLLYVAFPGRIRHAYLVSMIGSASGVLLSLGLLSLPTDTVALAGATAVPATCLVLVRRNAPARIAGIAVLTLAALVTALQPRLLEYEPSPYKQLSQLRQFSSFETMRSGRTVHGRIDSVRSPYIRQAPGLSLTYPEAVPPHDGVLLNGDNLLLLPRSWTDQDYTASSHPYAGYLVPEEVRSVLVVEMSGGTGPLCALRARIPEVTVVAASPPIADCLRAAYAGASIEVRAANPRALLASSTEYWDIIHIDAWGSSLPGMDSLDEQYMYTLDAFVDCLEALTPRGVIIVSRLLLTPPSGMLRLTATSWEACRAMGIQDPARHLVILRSWDSYTLLLTSSPLAPDSLHRVRGFAEAKRFDLVHAPGMQAHEANRYSVFPSPVYATSVAEVLEACAANRQEDLYTRYPVDIRPQTDDRPYLSRFVRWRDLGSLLAGSSAYRFITSGELVVPAVLALAMVISALLVVLSLVTRTGDARASGGPSLTRTAGYFGAIGLGFMFCEMALLKTTALLNCSPIINLAVVLATVTAASGAGSLATVRFRGRELRVLGLVSAALGLFAACLGPLARALLPAPRAVQIVASVAILTVVSLPLGLCFPLGMAGLARSPRAKGVAWSVNGAASVLASVSSTLIAMAAGIPWILAAAALCYACAALIIGLTPRKAPR